MIENHAPPSQVSEVQESMSISRNRLHLPKAGSTKTGKGLCICANCNGLLQPDPTSH